MTRPNVLSTATTNLLSMTTATNAANMATTNEVGNMEIDPIPSGSSASIHAPPKSPEIRMLSKEEKITLLVEAHVVLWNQCVAAQASGATDELKVLLNSAQDSQKALQKLIKRPKSKSSPRAGTLGKSRNNSSPKTTMGRERPRTTAAKREARRQRA